MTLANRTLLALAASLLTTAAQAQANPPAGQSFARLSPGEQQAKRTAQLIADSQYRDRTPAAPVYSSRLPTSVATQSAYVAPPAAPRHYERVPRTTIVPLVQGAEPPPAAPQVVYGSPTYDPSTAAGSVIPPMPQAISGECFAMVRVAEKYSSHEQAYELRAPSERLVTTPPRYEMVPEQYVVQEAYERMEVLPPTFRTVTDRVEATGPSMHYVSTEPVYETVTERVLEQPARSVWKPGKGAIQRIDNATGEIMCLVEEPAIYRNISRRVLKTPAQAMQVQEPGQYSLVNRRVLDQPAEVRRVVVPEQRATRLVRRLVEPGSVERVPVPGQVGVATIRELVEPGRLEWRSVLCETNMTPTNIKRVQAALQREGFNPGPVNGQLGGQTMAALNNYQRANKLPEDQYLNMESVRALGAL